MLIKCTQYFLAIRNRPDRSAIKEEWIVAAIVAPVIAETQSDGRTVQNAFFDRGFREE